MGGPILLLMIGCELNLRPVRTQGGGSKTNSTCVLFVARNGIRMQANARPARSIPSSKTPPRCRFYLLIVNARKLKPRPVRTRRRESS